MGLPLRVVAGTESPEPAPSWRNQPGFPDAPDCIADEDSQAILPRLDEGMTKPQNPTGSKEQLLSASGMNKLLLTSQQEPSKQIAKSPDSKRRILRASMLSQANARVTETGNARNQMKPSTVFRTFLGAVALCIALHCYGATNRVTCRPVIDNTQSPYTRLRCIPMQDTRLTEGFFAERFDLAATKMIPALEKNMLGECTANLNRIQWAAGLIEEPQHGSPWGDGDNYKWIESMAHAYNVTKNPELDKRMDEWIEIIGRAQESDGYISTNIRRQQGQRRFERSNAHEMYNMGHLLTAACVHYRATGKDNFLNIAKKTANFLCRQWKAEPVHMARFPWNPSVFMGMAEMYRATRDEDYLRLLETMINNRGSRPNPDRDHAYGGTDQTQDRVPLRQEHLAVGHAVTGTYYYCGAADLYAEIGDSRILTALERVWQDIHERKTDITLGVAMNRQSKSLSPRGDEVHENFANGPYLQPNLYSETCANIGAGMFNYRMFLLTGEAKYADWTERMLYNTLNSGVDLQGERFFYCNPVSWDGSEGETIRQTFGRDPSRMVPGHQSGERWEFMNCYCCPPSVARTTLKIHNWFYNVSDDGALWVNFYGGNQLSTALADGSTVALTQVTAYPWAGRVEVTLDAVATHKPVSLHFRIPGWTENPTVAVNGVRTDVPPVPGSYLEIYRYWNPGDQIVLRFPMPVRLMEANPKIIKLRGKVAVMRGPLVYCLELPKRERGEEVFKNGVYLPENIRLTPEYRGGFLGGITVLKGKALNHAGLAALQRVNYPPYEDERAEPWGDGELYRPLQVGSHNSPEQGTVDVEIIPYYAWANRGLAYMDVWIPVAR